MQRTESAVADFLDAFRKELSKLGWIEGKNLSIEYRFAEQKLDRLPELAAELVNQKVDLIVVGTGQAPLAAKKATSTIPIVMRTSVDPVGAGLIASLARPGGNITGLSGLSPELNTKRLEILNDAIPRLSRVGYLLTPEATLSVTGDLLLKEIRAAAMALKLKLEEIKPTGRQKLENAFKSAKQKQVGAIMTAPGSRMFAERKRIVELAVKHRLPAIYPNKGYVDAGGLMFYGAEDIADDSRRAAWLCGQDLEAQKAADLPVQQATKFEFVINLKAAKQIGLNSRRSFSRGRIK